MSVHIVGIHGIWQGNTNKVKLSADWSAALTKGLRTHHGSDCPVPPLDVAYYGDLFRSPSRHLSADGDSVLVEDTDPYTADEEAFVLDTLSLYAPPGTDDDRLPTETLGPGIPYTPQPIARRLAALDRKTHPDTGRRLLRLVRQVYRYLHHDIGERIRAEVLTDLHRPGPRLVIAHSLGSVIAFDMLTRTDIGPGPDGLTTLVTCGSPLAWPTVRRSLGRDVLDLPDGIDWVNLHATGDIVAVTGLTGIASAVRDEPVHNGRAEPHAVSRYLSQHKLADLIVRSGTP